MVTQRHTRQIGPRVDLTHVLGIVGAVPESCDDGDLFAHMLAFANADIRSNVEKMLAGDPHLPKIYNRRGKIDPEIEEAIAESVEETQQLRAGIRRLLDLALNDPEAVLAHLMQECTEALQSVSLRPQVTATRHGVAFNHRIEIRSDEQLLAYVAFLLADEKRGLLENLCQCRLESCRKFFLVKKPATGRPRRDYCSTDHMREAHALQSTARAQKSRANNPNRARKPK